MTESDWEQVEQTLSGLVGYVKLRADGRVVTFARGRISANRLGIATYIDGHFREAWCSFQSECPEQRYLRPVDRFLWPAKARIYWRRLSARERKILQKERPELVDIHAKVRSYSPIWPSAKAIRRHYERVFAETEFLYSGIFLL